MPFVIHRIDVRSARNEVLQNGLVSRDDREVERRVALLVLLVQQLGLGAQDLLDAGQVLVLGAVVEGGLARFVHVEDGVRLKNKTVMLYRYDNQKYLNYVYTCILHSNRQ